MTKASPGHSSPADSWDGEEDQHNSQGPPSSHTDPSQSSASHPIEAKVTTTVPMQKRRRVTRACDECRRKKIKCDGRSPVTHPTNFSYLFAQMKVLIFENAVHTLYSVQLW